MPEKKYHMTRIIDKYGWNSERKESERITINDAYDPMDWDDLISNIGYLVEGHKGNKITLEIKMDKEDE